MATKKKTLKKAKKLESKKTLTVIKGFDPVDK